MMEQGQVRGSKLTFHLKQFLARTFGVGKMGDLDIREVFVYFLLSLSFFAIFLLSFFHICFTGQTGMILLMINSAHIHYVQ